MNFVDVEPTLENYWRAIIFFGRNTASYKFSLARSILNDSSLPIELRTKYRQ